MAAFDSVDLDSIVDYRAEYTAVIKKYKISGDGLLGLCPFHEEKTGSFHVDFKTGQWNCFGCGDKGNFVSFWARLHNVDTKEAYKDILEKYGAAQEKPKPAPKQKQSANSSLGAYSIEQYSADKKLPVDFLRDTCKVSTGGGRYGPTYLRVPYIKADGQEATYRKRFANKKFLWKTGSKEKICLYGEWRLQVIKDAGYVILVEGESDTQSLWYMELPAMGVAGATMFKPEQAGILQGLKIYVHKEPDQGGETFTQKVYRGLKDGGFTGEVYQWECAALGAKDPSQVFMEKGKEEGGKLIRSLLAKAKPINLEAEIMLDVIPGAPIRLRQAEGFIYSEKGISEINQKTMTPALVCRTPIILTKRLKSLETGEERMEIAFKRDDRWHTAIYPRSTIFSSRKITELADLGCTITSENARQVVKFLGALEAENIDIIPKNDATSVLGWHSGRRFLPGHDGGITLDVDPSQRGMAAACCKNGTLERWIATMEPHRAREKFRFILAASFAAPLLRIVKQRSFIVYNWGNSKAGKTATLKAALSAWGDPEQLMVSFNTTAAGLERTAAFYCDLPLGIDERQQAGDKQNLVSQLVYMVSGEKGKTRANKDRGLQTTYQWRTVGLATGEEPISTDTTMTGVSTRTLEIYGGPFDNEMDASEMHQKAALDCGWAGPEFIGHILQMDERNIVDEYEQMQSYVRTISEGKNGSHIAGICVVALADAMIDQWFFGGTKESAWESAKAMTANILINQVESNATDVNETAVQFVTDWVLSNKAYFGPNVAGTCLGFFDEYGNIVYIYPSTLNQALKKAGYPPQKIMKYMADQGLVSSYTERTGKKTHTVMKWFGNRSTRFVEFHIGKISKNKDPADGIDVEEFPF